jgi:hypothetical protein
VCLNGQELSASSSESYKAKKLFSFLLVEVLNKTLYRNLSVIEPIAIICLVILNHFLLFSNENIPYNRITENSSKPYILLKN